MGEGVLVLLLSTPCIPGLNANQNTSKLIGSFSKSGTYTKLKGSFTNLLGMYENSPLLTI